MVVAALAHPPVDRLGDDVARREVGERVVAGRDDALAVERRRGTRPRRASPRVISGCWPGRAGAEEQRGRVELHELEVGDRGARRAGPARRRRRWRPTGWWCCAKTWPMPPVASTTARASTAPTPSCGALAEHVQGDARRPGRRRCAAGRAPARARRAGSAGAARTAATSARCTSAPVASPPACTIRSRWWPPSRVSDSSPAGSRSKAAPERDELAQPGRALGAQHAHGVDVAQPDAGDERVLQVVLGGVLRAERGGDAALRPARGAVVDEHLGDEQDAARAGGVQRGGQPGDAGADDDDVGRRRPAGLRGEQARASPTGAGITATSVGASSDVTAPQAGARQRLGRVAAPCRRPGCRRRRRRPGAVASAPRRRPSAP